MMSGYSKSALTASSTKRLNHFEVLPLAERTSLPSSPAMAGRFSALGQSAGGLKLHVPPLDEVLPLDEDDELLDAPELLDEDEELLDAPELLELLEPLEEELVWKPPPSPPPPAAPPKPGSSVPPCAHASRRTADPAASRQE